MMLLTVWLYLRHALQLWGQTSLMVGTWQYSVHFLQLLFLSKHTENLRYKFNFLQIVYSTRYLCQVTRSLRLKGHAELLQPYPFRNYFLNLLGTFCSRTLPGNSLVNIRIFPRRVSWQPSFNILDHRINPGTYVDILLRVVQQQQFCYPNSIRMSAWRSDRSSAQQARLQWNCMT